METSKSKRKMLAKMQSTSSISSLPDKMNEALQAAKRMTLAANSISLLHLTNSYKITNDGYKCHQNQQQQQQQQQQQHQQREESNECQISMLPHYDRHDAAPEPTDDQPGDPKVRKTRKTRNNGNTNDSNNTNNHNNRNSGDYENGDEQTGLLLARRQELAFSIEWRRLTYYWEPSLLSLVNGTTSMAGPKRKLLLRSLDGSFKSGQLSAILGPSGAGKSTFIECLFGKKQDLAYGETRVQWYRPSDKEGAPRVSIDYRRNLSVAIVPQDDHLLNHLTVRECLMFASKIKNSSTRCQHKGSKKWTNYHKANVQRVVDQLHLNECLGTRCAKLSGGQYKRVSIAQELLSNPDVIILDEPTSGLDALTCYQTVSTLKCIIQQLPISIILTIHQPDTDVFNLFDHVYVIAQGGVAIYDGPPSKLPERMASVGLRIPRYYNPARFVVENAFLARSNPHDANCLPHPHAARDGASAGELGGGRALLRQLNFLQKLQYHQPAAPISAGTPNAAGPSPTRSGPEAHLSGGYGKADDGPVDSNSDYASLRLNSGTPTSDLAPSSGRTERSSSSASSSSSGSTSSRCSTSNDSCLSGSGAHPANCGVHLSNGEPTMDQLMELGLEDAASGGGVTKLRRQFDRCLSAKYICSRRRYDTIYHAYQLLCRTWLAKIRDPVFFGIQFSMHTFIPILLALIFGRSSDNGCPKVGQFDLVEFAYSQEDVIGETLVAIRNSISNVGIIFLEMFVLCFAINCITALVFPIDMHVLIKEYRNGWYNCASYFMARTLVDLPVPMVLHTMAMAILYYSTGQPRSAWEWRFFTLNALVMLASLIAQSSGLTIGALLMKSPQSAILSAAAIVAPLFALSGFITRVHTLPTIPRTLAHLTSYLYHLINGFIITRYGFDSCQCDPQDLTRNPAHRIPDHLRTSASIWIGTFSDEYLSDQDLVRYAHERNRTTTNVDPDIDLVGKMLTTLARAKSFGHTISQCNDVVPYAMIEFNVVDADLWYCFFALATMLLVVRALTFFTIFYKIRAHV